MNSEVTVHFSTKISILKIFSKKHGSAKLLLVLTGFLVNTNILRADTRVQVEIK
jgi:hypothetical protein